MRRTGLTARILYALAAAPAAGFAGFYAGVLMVTRILPFLNGVPRPEPGWAEFVVAILFGVGAGFTAFFYALTLPQQRSRRRGGRAWRMAASALFILAVSVIAEAESVPLGYTAGLMLWLSVTLAFTFIRYGVLDSTRRRRSAA